MTAHRADADAWECLWFVGEELRSAVIAGDALEPADAPRGPKPVITRYPPGEGDESAD